MTLLQRIVALALLGVVLAGCAVQLRTAPAAAQGCDQALVRGRLVSNADNGLALKSETGTLIPILWPHGYTARREMTGIVLVGQKGETLAHEGDFVEAGGGTGNDAEFAICDGTVRVVPAPS